ncbi:MAG: 2-C-methyl-D-erythritol 2,4-cyclodiphosphate synthase [Lentisphaeria bacterium]
MELRIGQGYDIHQLVPGRRLLLGGFAVPGQTLGLLGHSDADVLLHAIIDALLGALALGDIGQHFSDQDTTWLNADSAMLLHTIRALPEVKDWQLVNLDSTLIAQTPRLAPYIERIRENLARLLVCPLDRISVKAKTNEKLDAVGRGEAMVAQVVVLLEKL